MQRLDEAKREAILNAAKQRLQHYGVQKTTMQEIAKDAGIAVGTLYLYFKNKDEILIATAEAFAQKHLVDASVILNTQIDPIEKLKRYIINRFYAAKESRQGNSHAAELTRTVIRLKPQWLDEQKYWMRKNVRIILTEGIEANLFHFDNFELDMEVFFYSIGYFFPMPSTEQYYEPEESELCKVMDWFIKQWMCR